MVKFKKRNHLCNLGAVLKDNPRKFWSYYKAITKSSKIPGVIKHESMQATRPVDQANLFNAFFHSVFAPPDHGSTSNCLHRLNFSVQHELCELKLSPNSILNQLKSLDINKASLGLPHHVVTRVRRGNCTPFMQIIQYVFGAGGFS